MASKSVLAWHRWIALTFAPFLLLQALTGSALLFRTELGPFFEPARGSPPAENAPISVLYNSARQLHPDMHPSRIFLPGHRGGGVFAHLAGGDGTTGYAMIDPGNGALLSEGSVWRYPLEAALKLHFQLNAGQSGLWLVCAYGIALALLAVTGLWHWWPGRKRAVRSLAIPGRTPSRLKLRMWHRSTGAVAAIALVVIAITGVLTAIPSLERPGLFASGTASTRPIVLSAAQIDRGVALAQAQFPQGAMRDIRFRPDGSIAVNFRAPRAGLWAVDTVIVDPAKPDTVRAIPSEADDALWTFTYPIHTGSIIGPIGRYIILVLAAGLAFLALSGPLQWWRNRTNRKSGS